MPKVKPLFEMLTLGSRPWDKPSGGEETPKLYLGYATHHTKTPFPKSKRYFKTFLLSFPLIGLTELRFSGDYVSTTAYLRRIYLGSFTCI